MNNNENKRHRLVIQHGNDWILNRMLYEPYNISGQTNGLEYVIEAINGSLIAQIQLPKNLWDLFEFKAPKLIIDQQNLYKQIGLQDWFVNLYTTSHTTLQIEGNTISFSYNCPYDLEDFKCIEYFEQSKSGYNKIYKYYFPDSQNNLFLTKIFIIDEKFPYDIEITEFDAAYNYNNSRFQYCSMSALKAKCENVAQKLKELSDFNDTAQHITIKRDVKISDLKIKEVANIDALNAIYPATGMLIKQTDTGEYKVYVNGAWETLHNENN